MDIIYEFGRTIDRLAPEFPAASRQVLLTGLRAFGWKLRHFPDKQLPPSRQYSAALMNRMICSMLTHPEKSAIVSVFQPCELLEAMDVIPMCAEMYAAYINGSYAEKTFAETSEAAGIAETYCSYHKVLLGSAFLGVLPRPQMIVNTSLVCDANHLTFRALAEHYHIPQFYVDVPPERSDESLHYVTGEMQELRVFLEDNLGRKLDENRLKEVMLRSKDTISSFKECLSFRRGHSLPGDLTSEMYEIYLTHNALGSREAQQYANRLLEDYKAAPIAHGIRLLWLHTIPIWQQSVRDIFNLNDRYQVIACDMCLEGLTEIDPENPYESMARRLVYSAWNGGGERVRAAITIAKTLKVDGVICFCHWGCKQTMGLSGIFKTKLEAAGFPTLILNGDGCDRRNASDGQTSTRLNAFLEMLEGNHHE